MGKMFLCKYFHCSCHATWLPCKSKKKHRGHHACFTDSSIWILINRATIPFQISPLSSIIRKQPFTDLLVVCFRGNRLTSHLGEGNIACKRVFRILLVVMSSKLFFSSSYYVKYPIPAAAPCTALSFVTWSSRTQWKMKNTTPCRNTTTT